MFTPEELRLFSELLHNQPTNGDLSQERQQELLLRGVVAAVEDAAAAAENGSASGAVELLREGAAGLPQEAVRRQAFQALLRLAEAGQGAAVDALYRLAVEDDLLAARQVLRTRGWLPGQPGLKALFDWFDRLESGEPYPESALIALTSAFFDLASPQLQRRLLNSAAQNKAENWARILAAVQRPFAEDLLDLVERYPNFRPAERQITLDLLTRLAAGAPEGKSEATRAAAEAAANALSQLFIRHEDAQARRRILEQGCLPADPQQRALFLFLAESWPEYEALDFNHNLLTNAYETAGRSLRRRLLEHSRHTGRMDWLRELSSSGEVHWLGDLTDADWELALRRLLERGQLETLWRLAQSAPPIWSAAILERLSQQGWQPQPPDERAIFETLAQLAGLCHAAPLPIRPKQLLQTPLAEITCLALHPSGRLLAAGTTDQYIYQWSLPDGKLREPALIAPAPVTRALTFSPDGELIVSAGGDNRIRAFRLNNGQMVKTFEGHRAMIRSLAVHPDGRTLYSAGFDGSIRFWRFPYGAEQKVLRPSREEIFSLELGAGGQHLISGGADGLVRVWTLPEGLAARELPGHSDTVTYLAASPTSELVVSAGRDGMLRVWNFTSGGLVRAIENRLPLTALCLHPNDQVIIGGSSSGKIFLWNISTGRVLQELPGRSAPVTGFALSTLGDTLYSADSSGHLRAWDLHTFLAMRLVSEIARPGAAANLEERRQNAPQATAERKWLTFAAELARWRQRFDIELAEQETIQIGEFDIEL